MTLYVDNANLPYGRMLMCHMVTDSKDLNELHKMAERIGLKREWFQNHSIPHYDISLSKKGLAISYGAKEVSSKELIRRATRKQ